MADSSVHGKQLVLGPRRAVRVGWCNNYDDDALMTTRCHPRALEDPAQQAALAGAWEKTSWQSANTFAGGVEVKR